MKKINKLMMGLLGMLSAVAIANAGLVWHNPNYAYYPICFRAISRGVLIILCIFYFCYFLKLSKYPRPAMSTLSCVLNGILCTTTSLLCGFLTYSEMFYGYGYLNSSWIALGIIGIAFWGVVATMVSFVCTYKNWGIISIIGLLLTPLAIIAYGTTIYILGPNFDILPILLATLSAVCSISMTIFYVGLFNSKKQ